MRVQAAPENSDAWRLNIKRRSERQSTDDRINRPTDDELEEKVEDVNHENDLYSEVSVSKGRYHELKDQTDANRPIYPARTSVAA